MDMRLRYLTPFYQKGSFKPSYTESNMQSMGSIVICNIGLTEVKPKYIAWVNLHGHADNEGVKLN